MGLRHEFCGPQAHLWLVGLRHEFCGPQACNPYWTVTIGLTDFSRLLWHHQKVTTCTYWVLHFRCFPWRIHANTSWRYWWSNVKFPQSITAVMSIARWGSRHDMKRPSGGSPGPGNFNPAAPQESYYWHYRCDTWKTLLLDNRCLRVSPVHPPWE